MGYFAVLDVSLEESAVCVVDETGKIVREARVVSDPEVQHGTGSQHSKTVPERWV